MIHGGNAQVTCIQIVFYILVPIEHVLYFFDILVVKILMNTHPMNKVAQNPIKKTRKESLEEKLLGSTATLDDLLHIITCDEQYQRKLIFTNTNDQNNSIIYEEVLKKLTVRANERGEKLSFNIKQVSTKFKWCVSDCKKAARP